MCFLTCKPSRRGNIYDAAIEGARQEDLLQPLLHSGAVNSEQVNMESPPSSRVRKGSLSFFHFDLARPASAVDSTSGKWC